MSPTSFNSEMGRAFTKPFRKASHTLPTPPDSPQVLPMRLKSQPSRFRLPNLLRRTQTVDITSRSVVATGLQRASGTPVAHGFSEQGEPNILPSPAVLKTPHLLPCIPAVGQEPGGWNDSLSRKSPRKLRRMPKSFHDLRPCKSDNQLCRQPSSTEIKAPALLPSPLLSDFEDGIARHGFLASNNSRSQEAVDIIDYDDIVSGYCEDVFGGDCCRPEKTFAVTAPQSGTLAALPEQAFPGTSPGSYIPASLRSPRRDRSSSLSSEATWLSKSFGHQAYSMYMGQVERIQTNEKRLVEKSRRCCHVVEGPIDDSWTGERNASYATVIKPGKANDIWVPGSSSFNSHDPSQPRPGHWTDGPRTPERKASEVSAFSPWDSPIGHEARGGNDRGLDRQLRKDATYGDPRPSFQVSTPTRKPFFPLRKTSLQPVLASATPMFSSPSSITSTLTSNDGHLQDLLPRPGPAYTGHRAWAECGALARILDELEQAMDGYPFDLLQMDSQVITRLRGPVEKSHLHRLAQIFPTAQPQHLSALAAMLLAQSYLNHLDLPVTTPPPSRAAADPLLPMTTKSSYAWLSGTPTGPNQAMTTWGTDPADNTATEPAWALGRRAKAVEAGLVVAVQEMMSVICGRWDELLWKSLLCLVETVEEYG